jgi:hypothetical protein
MLSSKAGNAPRRATLPREKFGDASRQDQRLARIVGDADLGKQVGQAHHAQADFAGAPGGGLDFGKRVATGLDDIVQEHHRIADGGAQTVPV